MVGATLHLGDCLDPATGLASLANGAVAVTLTDPPFDARAHAGVTGGLPFAPLDPARLGELAAQLVRVTRRWIVVFAAERQFEPWAAAIEAAGGRVVRHGIVVKRNPAPRRDGAAPGVGVDHLVIAYAGAGRTAWNGGGRAGVWHTSQAHHETGEQLHPTQKAVALMRELVEAFSDAGESVLDPFAGSGSGLVAAVELGRRALGWELHPDYHAIAEERLAAAVPGAPVHVPRRVRRLATRRLANGEIDDARLPPRFWAKVSPEPNTGCWLWIGCGQRSGYGHATVGGRMVKAHRTAYQALVGPIPEGMQLDHLCRTPACVNPRHLEPVTARENMHRASAADPQAAAAARQLAAEGRSLRTICRDLAAAGHRPRRGERWWPSAVQSLLRRAGDQNGPLRSETGQKPSKPLTSEQI